MSTCAALEPSVLSLPTASPRLPAPRAELIPLSRGSAAVYPAALLPPGLLAQTDIARRLCDHRYYRVVERTLSHHFPLFYLVLKDAAGALRGAQPFFIVDQDILAGMQGKVPDLADRVRAKYPRFLTLKTLMLGNPAGPGGLGIIRRPGAREDQDRHWFSQALGEALAIYAARHRIRIVVFKDFPVEARPDMAGLTDGHAHGPDFLRIPSMPMTGLSLSPYTSFEDYMTRALSKATRKNLRRKFKATASEKIELSVTGDITDCVDDVHRLYLQVYDRAAMKFEKLTPDFFRALAEEMPDRVRYFLWRRQGQLIAVSITLIRTADPAANLPSALIDLYLGMEYPLALDLHMYFVTMRDIIEWCIANNIANYYSTPLNYDAKLHFRHKLIPQDLYVRHTSSILNPAFKFAMRFAEPTRHDKIIHQFPNAHEL